MPDGTYATYTVLVDALPPLVRKQRRLESVISAVAQHVKDEKAIRGDIDALLVKAGLTKGELVTCLGYDVKHNERDGQVSINAELLTELLAKAGVERKVIATILKASTQQGEVSKFATVKPSKGAKVRP